MRAAPGERRSAAAPPGFRAALGGSAFGRRRFGVIARAGLAASAGGCCAGAGRRLNRGRAGSRGRGRGRDVRGLCFCGNRYSCDGRVRRVVFDVGVRLVHRFRSIIPVRVELGFGGVVKVFGLRPGRRRKDARVFSAKTSLTFRCIHASAIAQKTRTFTIT